MTYDVSVRNVEVVNCWLFAFGIVNPSKADETTTRIKKALANPKLAEAFASACNRIDDDQLKYRVINYIVLLRSFSLLAQTLDSDNAIGKWMKEIYDTAEDAGKAIGDLEQNKFRMRNWFPKWLANK